VYVCVCVCVFMCSCVRVFTCACVLVCVRAHMHYDKLLLSARDIYLSCYQSAAELFVKVAIAVRALNQKEVPASKPPWKPENLSIRKLLQHLLMVRSCKGYPSAALECMYHFMAASITI